jgi:hypothetical protein
VVPLKVRNVVHLRPRDPVARNEQTELDGGTTCRPRWARVDEERSLLTREQEDMMQDPSTTLTSDALTSNDDPMGTRDWEGPIPTSVPTRRRREKSSGLRRAGASFQSSLKRIEREVQARPLVVIGAAFGLGALAGLAVRGSIGRALLGAVARGLSKLD